MLNTSIFKLFSYYIAQCLKAEFKIKYYKQGWFRDTPVDLDINNDDRVDSLTLGNFFGSSIDEGRYGEYYGTVLLNTSEGW